MFSLQTFHVHEQGISIRQRGSPWMCTSNTSYPCCKLSTGPNNCLKKNFLSIVLNSVIAASYLHTSRSNPLWSWLSTEKNCGKSVFQWKELSSFRTKNLSISIFVHLLVVQILIKQTTLICLHLKMALKKAQFSISHLYISESCWSAWQNMIVFYIFSPVCETGDFYLRTVAHQLLKILTLFIQFSLGHLIA